MNSVDYVKKGQRFIDNLAPNVSPAYLGNVKSGRSVALSGDGEVDVPINATIKNVTSNDTLVLNVDDYSITTNAIDATSVDFTIDTKGTGNTYPRVIIHVDDSPALTDAHIISFDYTGDATIKQIWAGGKLVSVNSNQDGNYRFNIEVNRSITIYFDGTIGDAPLNAKITNLNIEKVVSVQGQIAYFDFAQKKHVSPALPLSTKYTLKDVTFNNLVRLWDREFTQDDLALIDTNHEILVRFGLSEDKSTTGLSITKEANDLVYACMDSNTTLYEINKNTANNLTIVGTYLRQTNLQYGIQSTDFKLDSDDVPTSLTTPNTISFKNNNTAIVDTQLKPKLDPMTIMQIVEGNLEDLDGDGNSAGTKSQRTEERILVIDSANGNKYYTDKTLQTYVPALPVSTTTLKLTNTAMIGYPDTIDATKTKAQAWNKALTQEEVNEL